MLSIFQRVVANASGVQRSAFSVQRSWRRVDVSAFSVLQRPESSGARQFRMTSHLFGFVADIPWNGRI
jgi:hypothetical protein